MEMNYSFFKATIFLILGGGIICATTVLKLIAMLTPCEYDDKLCTFWASLLISHIWLSFLQDVKIEINLRTVVAQTIPPPKMKIGVALKKGIIYYRGHSLSTRKEVMVINYPFVIS